MADILEEQRNPTSTTSKRTYVHKANRTPKDPIYQNKDSKRIESSKLFNCYRKPNRGSNHNMLFENNDNKTFKNIKTELESDLNLELESFTYIIKTSI